MKRNLPTIKKIFNLCFVLLFPLFLNAQLSTFTTSSTTALGGTFNLSSNKGGVGPAAPMGVMIKGSNGPLMPSSDAKVIAAANYAFANIPANKYYRAKAKEPFNITITGSISAGCNYSINNYSSFTYSETYNGTGNRNYTVTNSASSGSANFNFTISNITFPKGAEKGFLVLTFFENKNEFDPNCSQQNALGTFSILLPFVVEGIVDPKPPIVLDGSSLPRIITQPSIPITILHAPPGDQSFTKIISTKTTCQSTEEAITTGLANTGSGSIKLGFKGSIGFVATVDIEAFVEFTASGTDGNTTVKTRQKETCISHSNGFTTPASGVDIFVCEGMDFNYGIFEEVSIVPVTYLASTKKGLAMVPVDDSKKLSFYSRQNIIDQIEARRLDTLNPSLPLKDKINAKNQLNVWKQIITINDNNVANASVSDPNFPNTVEVTNSVAFDASTTVSTSQTNTLTVDHYVEAEVGIQGVVNIGGSGFSAGYNFRTSKNFGQTNSATSSSGNTIDVHIQDNEADDVIKVKVFRDPMYGTPLFKLQPGIPNARVKGGLASGSQTSCPYEGGYQTDQPKIKHTGANSAQTHITKNQPSLNLADAATFDLQICNDSDYPRGYLLGIGTNTNFNGAIIFAGGFNISQTPHLFTVPAHTCLSNPFLNINVSRQNNASPTNFPNIEFEFKPSCADEGAISSSVFATVTFGSQTPLPVELISFKGKASEKGNELEWKIASEKNFSHYEIERSIDSKAFMKIGEIKGAGNGKEKLVYNFIDGLLGTPEKSPITPSADSPLSPDGGTLSEISGLFNNQNNISQSNLNAFQSTPPSGAGGLFYYRLVMIDLDGSKKLSNIIAIDRKSNEISIQNIFPNPVNNSLTVSYSAENKSNAEFKVFDFSGKLIYENIISSEIGANSKEIDARNWAAGAYFLKISNGQNVTVKKIIKQ